MKRPRSKHFWRAAALKAWESHRRWAAERRRPYWTKAAAVRAFLADGNNSAIAEEHSRPSTDGEYDAVNERYDRRGTLRVTTVPAAVAACLPRGAPYFLDRLDLETLNLTAPALHNALGRPFEMPSEVVEAEVERQAVAHYEEQALASAC